MRFVAFACSIACCATPTQESPKAPTAASVSVPPPAASEPVAQAREAYYRKAFPNAKARILAVLR